MKIFNTFHVFLLELKLDKLRRNLDIYKTYIENENDDRIEKTIELDPNYEVERILDSREEEDGQLYYYIKWKGYNAKDNTWEPKYLLSCYQTIRVVFDDRVKS